MKTPAERLIHNTITLANASASGDNENNILTTLVSALLPFISGKSDAIKQIANTILNELAEDYPDHQVEVNQLRKIAGLPELFLYYSHQDIEDYFKILRESGEINMFGASPYLQRQFGMPKKLADSWVSYFMSQ